MKSINLNIDEVKEVVRDFFNRINIEMELEFLPLIENENKDALSEADEKFLTLPLNIQTKEDAKILIGEKGQTLTEIHHLLKMILRKKFSHLNLNLDIDINDYKKKKGEFLKEVAQGVADEVVFSKREKSLPAMSSYERRIIHLELSKRSDVATKSIGEGQNRKIIIKPAQ